MLGRNYRYQVVNGTGVSITATIKGRAWKFDSTGARSDATEVTHLNAAAVGAGSIGTGGNVDNSTDKNLGEHLAITLAPSATATGAVEVYLQHSTDGGATWPAAGQGRRIGYAYFAGSATSTTVNAEAQ